MDVVCITLRYFSVGWCGVPDGGVWGGGGGNFGDSGVALVSEDR